MMLMTADRPELRGGSYGGMTGLCFNGSSLPDRLIHLLSPQTVPGFAVFLWDNRPSHSS